jgi:hypothetical protein
MLSRDLIFSFEPEDLFNLSFEPENFFNLPFSQYADGTE